MFLFLDRTVDEHNPKRVGSCQRDADRDCFESNQIELQEVAHAQFDEWVLVLMKTRCLDNQASDVTPFRLIRENNVEEVGFDISTTHEANRCFNTAGELILFFLNR
ncbi:unnamed protein product [Brassica oleracea var. botrytis]